MNNHDRKQDWELAKQISKDPTFKENVGKYGVYGGNDHLRMCFAITHLREIQTLKA